jgi:hypothetical protein
MDNAVTGHGEREKAERGETNESCWTCHGHGEVDPGTGGQGPFVLCPSCYPEGDGGTY